MTPAMILSWLFGLVLIHEIGFEQLASLWLRLKLIFRNIINSLPFLSRITA